MVGQSHTVYPLVAFKRIKNKLAQGVGAVLWLFLLLQCCVLFKFFVLASSFFFFFFFFFSTFFSFQSLSIVLI